MDYRKHLKFGASLCAYPFIHKHINTKKQCKLCCHSEEPLASDDFNGSEMTAIREKMRNGERISNCDVCYRLEDRGMISARQKSLKEFGHQIDFEQDEYTPYWYDLRISNLCNLSCQMCGPEASSMLAKAQGVDDAFLSFEPEIEINPETVRLYLAGGEPFLIKRFVDVLDAVDNPYCEVVINTNATYVNPKIVDALRRFKNVALMISLDGYGAVNDRIRLGSKWGEIDKNLTRFRELNYTLHVNTVVQKDNINNLAELGNYLLTKHIDTWTLSMVEDNPHMIPTSIEQSVFDELKKNPLVKHNVASLRVIGNINDA